MNHNLILKISLRLGRRELGNEYCKINPQKKKWDFIKFLIKSSSSLVLNLSFTLSVSVNGGQR